MYKVPSSSEQPLNKAPGSSSTGSVCKFLQRLSLDLSSGKTLNVCVMQITTTNLTYGDKTYIYTSGVSE